MSDQENNNIDFDKTIKLMRLLLLGQFIDKTGVLWFIFTRRYQLDAKFICRYGFAKHEVLEVDIGLEKAEDYIEDMMNEISWDITKAYGRRQKTKHDWPEE